jgi:glycerol-3-phosphate O-acyltransferase/dihydroxyacetone phosphate acyltransferase
MARKKDTGLMNKYVYDAFLWTFSILVELFFREVHPRSSWKVPKEGPVIFVCAPHANQVRETPNARDCAGAGS